MTKNLQTNKQNKSPNPPKKKPKNKNKTKNPNHNGLNDRSFQLSFLSLMLSSPYNSGPPISHTTVKPSTAPWHVPVSEGTRSAGFCPEKKKKKFRPGVDTFQFLL